MDRRFNLKVEDVLEKQFNIDFKGYAASEVDEFLDMVIQDYQQYEGMIQELGATMQKYENTIETMKAKISELETSSKNAEEHVAAYSNVDILKRLSRLEAEVFKR